MIMTAGDRNEARRIAEMLVSQNLAACVQLLPGIDSIYRWKGEINREQEVLMLAKTHREKFADLERAVRAIHSYETPEIIALGIEEGSEPYLQWLTNLMEGS